MNYLLTRKQELVDLISETSQAIKKFNKNDHADVYDWRQRYNEMLDGVYGEVSICGYTYDSSRALKLLDPIAYKCGFNDWINSLDNGEFSEYNKLVEQLEDLESELLDIQEQLESENGS